MDAEPDLTQPDRTEPDSTRPDSTQPDCAKLGDTGLDTGQPGSTDLALPTLRVARPASDIVALSDMYRKGLGWSVLAEFDDHDGFDGVIVGAPGGVYHLEFTACRDHPISPQPTPEDLLVFYVENPNAWHQRCYAMVAAGFETVAAFNPYWDTDGRTFVDLDGYRVVIQRAAWARRLDV